jgi:gamma-glutamyl hercynylcysteine S-oxide synthase
MKLRLTFILLITPGLIFFKALPSFSQAEFTIDFNKEEGLKVKKEGPGQRLLKPVPFLSMMNKDKKISTSFATRINDSTYLLDGSLELRIKNETAGYAQKYSLQFVNESEDTLTLHNVVPFGESDKHVYITGKGSHYLSRSHLFRPGLEPVNVILPDNAWELGFSAINLSGDSGICALVRRDRNSLKNGKTRRFETDLYPGGTINYTFWGNSYQGEWQNALRLIFQQRFLYDVEPGTFDNSMFERNDLTWFRDCYALNIIFNWDTKHYYNYLTGELQVDNHLKKMKKLMGGYDVFSIWPTWPTLGMDQRNQWDLFNDLPGGYPGLKELSEICNKNGSKLFICYNPWDESTDYKEGHYNGLARLVEKSGAMGVVIDTRNESSKELQEAVDSVRKGVIMYSEGMALPKGMQYIPSGRVHNALYYPPLLNLNKFIKPDFVIFRVAEIYKEKIRREFALSLFNGYGTEINNMPPGTPEWYEEQFRYWGELIRIQRENSSCFQSFDYVPLIPVARDKIYVNKWPAGSKTIYTIFSLLPQGFKGELFMESPDSAFHFVDLYHYEEINPVRKNETYYIPVKLDAFNEFELHTNNEGTAGAVARLPRLLSVTIDMKNDLLKFSAPKGNLIRIWAGKPTYEKQAVEFGIKEQTIRLLEYFPGTEGKFVVQLFDNNDLLDMQIVMVPHGTARLISQSVKTDLAKVAPEGMLEIPAGNFSCKEFITGDSFIPYPEVPVKKGETIKMDRFFMDKYPVTNRQFKSFLRLLLICPRIQIII